MQSVITRRDVDHGPKIYSSQKTRQNGSPLVLPIGSGMMDICTAPSNDILAILDARATAMTIAECADLLHADPGTLYRHSKSGKFPTFQISGMVRVNPAELACHIRASSNTSVQPIDRRYRRAA